MKPAPCPGMGGTASLSLRLDLFEKLVVIKRRVMKLLNLKENLNRYFLSLADFDPKLRMYPPLKPIAPS